MCEYIRFEKENYTYWPQISPSAKADILTEVLTGTMFFIVFVSSNCRDNIDVDIAGANLYQRYINAAAENKNCALSASRQPPNNGIFLPQTVTEIYGILVKTGVSFASSGITHSHRDFTLDSDILKPHIILDNVLDAIQYIIKNES